MKSEKIILCTINAKCVHAALGLRYLLANMGELKKSSAVMEFDLRDSSQQIVEKLLQESPSIIGFGVYIWNTCKSKEVVNILSKVAPNIRLIIGGPEVTHCSQQFLSDFGATVAIGGEADLCFAETCEKLIKGESVERFIQSAPPELLELKLPYLEYSDKDLKSRLIYVEISRGCVFKCEFCLSSLDQKVRLFNEEDFLKSMKDLLDRGCLLFKFVDRTFNLNIPLASRILEFFIAEMREGLFLHFEMIPDRLPESLKGLIKKFPLGSLQFEVGIQSFSPEVGELISRKMDLKKMEDSFRFFREECEVNIHADLIAGLPGDSEKVFSESFDRLWELKPEEIQVGILKLLRGTAIERHVKTYEMVFNPEPPYDLLQSSSYPFLLMQKMKRFAHYVEIFLNSHRFDSSFSYLMTKGSPFEKFSQFCNWVWRTTQKEHAFSLRYQIDLVFSFLTQEQKIDSNLVGEMMADDFLNPKVNPKKVCKGLPDCIRARVESRLHAKVG